MSKKQPQTLIEKYRAIQKIGTEVEVPFINVSRLVHGRGKRTLQIFGDQVALGGTDADFGSLEDVRGALSWYVEQLGGEVKWK